MATLVIRLCDNHKNTAMHFNDAGALERSESFTHLSEIKNHTEEKLIILLPGSSVHMTTAVLPNMSATELQQAAPNLLEEQLAEDISTLHFAIGDANTDNKRHIAVINKETWDALITDLKNNRLAPALIIPDYLALTLDADSWTLFCEHEYSLVRLGQQDGYACDTALLNTLISLNLAETQEAPESVKLIHDNNIKAPQLDVTSPLNTRSDSFSNLIHPNTLLNDPPFNMTTKQFRKKRQKNQRSYWYWCGVSFASLLVVLFLGQLALFTDFKIKSNQLDHKMLSTYQKVFPGATQLVEPKFRIEQQLKEYELAPNPFMQILARIGQVKKQNSNIDITTLSYTNNKITFIAVANNNSDLNQFNKQLTHAGLKITSNQTNTANKKITETLSVELL